MFRHLLSRSQSLMTSVSRGNFSSQLNDNPRYFVLQYDYVQDFHYKRVPYREQHNELIQKLEDKGNMIFGGTCFPSDGSFLLFNCEDERTPYDFVKQDPYYKNGLIANYKIKEIEVHTRTKFKELAKIYKYY